MSYADTTRARILIRPKANYGDAFTLGATHFQDLRFTGESLKAAKETADDDEIRGDGSMGRQVQVGKSTSGDINATLSYGTYDNEIAAALRNPVTGWSSDALGVGVAPAIFDIERGLLDVSRFFPLVDQYLNTMTLDIQSKRKIGLTFGFLGAQGLAATTASIDPTPIAKTTTAHMRTGAGIPTLNLGINGGAVGAHPGKVTSLRLQTNAGLRARPNVQSDVSDVMGIGEFGVSVTISGYLADATLYSAAQAHQDVELHFVTADDAGNQYAWHIDRATISDHSVNAGAKNQDVLNNYTINGYGANALRIIRTAAV